MIREFSPVFRKTYNVATHSKRLSEALLMSTHTIFYGEIEKVSQNYHQILLNSSGALQNVLTLVMLNKLRRHTHF